MWFWDYRAWTMKNGSECSTKANSSNNSSKPNNNHKPPFRPAKDDTKPVLQDPILRSDPIETEEAVLRLPPFSIPKSTSPTQMYLNFQLLPCWIFLSFFCFQQWDFDVRVFWLIRWASPRDPFLKDVIFLVIKFSSAIGALGEMEGWVEWTPVCYTIWQLVRFIMMARLE